MAINVDKAFENLFGFAVVDSDTGTQKFYLTSGSGAPTGSAAPVNTWYFRQDDNTLWYKFGSLNSEWRQIRANDITSVAAAGTPPGTDVETRLNAISDEYVPFDPSGLPNFLGTETNVEDALDTLGNQTLASQTNFQEFEDNAQDNTTSNGWVTATTFTTEAVADGRYYVGVASNVGQSDKEKKFGFRVQSRDGTSGGWSTINPLDVEETVGSDETFKLLSGFGFHDHDNGDGVFQIRIQFGQTDDGGTARIKNNKVIAYKVADI